MRLRTFVVVVAVLVLGWPGVAHAKGPTEGVIEGDSLKAPIVIAGEEGGSSDFWSLVELSGFFETTFGQTPSHTMAAAPTADLGPAFVVRWRVPYDVGVSDEIRQTLYPYAAGGPLTYTEAGQTFFGDQRTVGGWYRASPRMTATLERLGVPAPAAPTKPATPATSATARPAAPPPEGRSWWPVVAVVAPAAAVGLATAVALGRRRVRVSPA